VHSPLRRGTEKALTTALSERHGKYERRDCWEGHQTRSERRTRRAIAPGFAACGVCVLFVSLGFDQLESLLHFVLARFGGDLTMTSQLPVFAINAHSHDIEINQSISDVSGGSFSNNALQSKRSECPCDRRIKVKTPWTLCSSLRLIPDSGLLQGFRSTRRREVCL